MTVPFSRQSYPVPMDVGEEQQHPQAATNPWRLLGPLLQTPPPTPRLLGAGRRDRKGSFVFQTTARCKLARWQVHRQDPSEALQRGLAGTCAPAVRP